MVNFKEDSRYILLSQNFENNTNELTTVIEKLSKSWLGRVFFSKQISKIQKIRDNQYILKDKCLSISSRSILQESEINIIKRTLLVKDTEIGSLVKSKTTLIAENKQARTSLNEFREKLVNMEQVVKNLTTTVNAYNKAEVKTKEEPVLNKTVESVTPKSTVPAKTVVQKKVSNSSSKKRGRGRPKKA